MEAGYQMTHIFQLLTKPEYILCMLDIRYQQSCYLAASDDVAVSFSSVAILQACVLKITQKLLMNLDNISGVGTLWPFHMIKF